MFLIVIFFFAIADLKVYVEVRTLVLQSIISTLGLKAVEEKVRLGKPVFNKAI